MTDQPIDEALPVEDRDLPEEERLNRPPATDDVKVPADDRLPDEPEDPAP